MPIDVTRRGFLAGLLGATVIAVVPKAAQVALASEIAPIDPWAIQAPFGTTYQWVRCALLGEPDPLNVEKRLENGWTFVAPSLHPGAPLSTAERAIETCGLILMEKPTIEVNKALAVERKAIEARLTRIGYHDACRRDD